MYVETPGSGMAGPAGGVARLRGYFGTRLAADPVGAMRTFGALATVPGDVRGATCEDLSSLLPAETPDNCAQDKVVLVGDDGAGAIICFQVSRDRRRWVAVACQNGAAAAPLVLDAVAAESQRTLYLARDRAARVSMRCEARDDGLLAVAQAWHDVNLRCTSERPAGPVRIARVAGDVNCYALVRCTSASDFDAIDLARAMTLWDELWPGGDRLLSRVLVLGPAGAGELRVKTFTCGDRQHPSAPPTGLAVLRAASQDLAWFDTPPNRVETPNGTMPLPSVERVSVDRASVTFAPLLVRLSTP